jgi:DNA-binding MarR family transcriptional regulator
MARPREELVTSVTHEWTRLGAELTLLSQSVADRLKINVTDLQCLAVVASAGPMTAGQIAEATGLTTGAITGVVDRLEKAGLVRREDDPTDRRRVVVRALPGDELLARDPAVSRALTGLEAAVAEQYESYSDRELALVVDALSRAHPLLLQHVAELRAQPPIRHELDAPLAGTRTGRLILAGGAVNVTLDADAAMTGLYRAQAEGTPPVIEVDQGTVTVKPRRFPLFGWGHRALRLTLSGAIPWDIEVGGGAVGLTSDLHGARIRSFTVRGGAVRVDLRFGPPAGAVPITIAGGAHRVAVRRPAGAPVDLRIKGGLASVRVDGRNLGPASGNFAYRSDEGHAAADRYTIDIKGGVNRLNVEGHR